MGLSRGLNSACRTDAQARSPTAPIARRPFRISSCSGDASCPPARAPADPAQHRGGDPAVHVAPAPPRHRLLPGHLAQLGVPALCGAQPWLPGQPILYGRYARQCLSPTQSGHSVCAACMAWNSCRCAQLLARPQLLLPLSLSCGPAPQRDLPPIGRSLRVRPLCLGPPTAPLGAARRSMPWPPTPPCSASLSTRLQGSVSILAHSLGTVLCYDILCNQQPAAPGASPSRPLPSPSLPAASPAAPPWQGQQQQDPAGAGQGRSVAEVDKVADGPTAALQQELFRLRAENQRLHLQLDVARGGGAGGGGGGGSPDASGAGGAGAPAQSPASLAVPPPAQPGQQAATEEDAGGGQGYAPQLCFE